MKILRWVCLLSACLPACLSRGADTPAGAVRPAPIVAADWQAYTASAEKELRENILPFWLKYARNVERGGFHSFIGEDMKVIDTLPRGCLLTSRILWTFSAAFQRYHDPAYGEMARWAYRDLVDNFLDKQHGGFFWTITPDGQPLDAHKQVYGQVFALYALSEFYRATSEKPALDHAIALYRLLEANAADPKNGGYFDSLTRDWHRETKTADNLLGDAPKSQNSHIHILEGYTNLLRLWPDHGLHQRLHALVELTMTRILNPRTHHLVLFMQDDWTPIGDEISYGHDIELSWLLVEAAEVLGDPVLLTRARQEAVAIAQVTDAEGTDRDGGVYIEGNPRGPTNTNKEWWEQAEAAVGFLNAFEISGDPAQAARSLRSWKFIQDKFVDRQNGDWHNTLRRDGSVIMTAKARDGRTYPSAKLSLWKCPYHNSRACMEIIDRVDVVTTVTPNR